MHKILPVLLCAASLAQSTAQYYCIERLARSTSQYSFVLQGLCKALPSTTSYPKACTMYFPVLLRTARLAQKYFPVLLCTTGLAQGTSQYCVVLQDLRRVLPSTALYYKGCAKYFPVLCITQLAQALSSTTSYNLLPRITLYGTTFTKYLPVLHVSLWSFAQVFCRKKLLHTESVGHLSFYTQKRFTHRSLTEPFRQRNFNT